MKKSFLSRATSAMGRHKFLSSLIIIALIAGTYGTYWYTHRTPSKTQYIVSASRLGTLTQTVTGSGQVSAQNQLDIKSEVSGDILTIPVSVGQYVTTGTIIATIDPHNAAVDLENARISYAKLTEPAKERDILEVQTSLDKSYTDSFTTMIDFFSDMPEVMDGIDNLFYTDAGFLSDQKSVSLNSTERTYREEAGRNYDAALKTYNTVLAEYKIVSTKKSKGDIESLLTKTISLASDVSATLKDIQNTITYIIKNNPNYNSSTAATTVSNVISWQNTINSSLGSLISARNAIVSNANKLETITEDPDALDIQSERLSLTEKQRTYEKYFIRAPFDGIIGRIPVNIHDTAGNGTVIATLASQNKVTNIPLNEVDAVKVSNGNKVVLGFDALDDVSMDAAVVSIDNVGVANQGVVTYNVKIAFNADDTRIKPGMSVDATITTVEKPDVLLVPSSAVKTQAGRKYVEVFDRSVLANNNPGFQGGQRIGSSTRPMGAGAPMGTGMTISPDVAPTQVEVTVGDSNETYTEILSGITAGDIVVTRTLAASGSTAQSSTPTLFSSFGGQRTGGNAVRTPR